MKISVIIKLTIGLMLSLVLKSLNRQKPNMIQVLIADDGSDNRTADLINELKNHLNFTLKHGIKIKDFVPTNTKQTILEATNTAFLLMVTAFVPKTQQTNMAN